MTRIRTVKPEFFRHEELFDCEKEYQLPLRLAYIGLWTCCDREGRFRWRPRSLKCDILPYDELDFAKVLDVLEVSGFIKRYSYNNEFYGYIPSWSRNQFPNTREQASQLPAPPTTVVLDKINKVQPLEEGSHVQHVAKTIPRSDNVITNRASTTTTVVNENEVRCELALNSCVKKPVSIETPRSTTMFSSDLPDTPNMHCNDRIEKPKVSSCVENVIVTPEVDPSVTNNLSTPPTTALLSSVPTKPRDHGAKTFNQQTNHLVDQLEALHGHWKKRQEEKTQEVHASKTTALTAKVSGCVVNEDKSISPDRQRNTIIDERPLKPDQQSIPLSHSAMLEVRHGKPVSIGEQVTRLFEHWKKMTHHEHAKLDFKRERVIKAALKQGYSIEDLCQAVEGCCKTPFNMGHNDQGQRYDGLQLILRDAEHIDRFIQHCHSPSIPTQSCKTHANVEPVINAWLASEKTINEKANGYV
jgi:hypothetical protein